MRIAAPAPRWRTFGCAIAIVDRGCKGMSLLPSVSVIIPVKNGAQYLAESLRSVLAQDHTPCEILVLDDESTDETEAIVRQFAADGARFIANHQPLGIAGSLNLGIQLARGELLAFTSHDDIWVSHKLSRQAECLMTQAELDYCIALLRPFLDRSMAGPPPGFPSELLGVTVPGYVIETLVARRRAFERAGYFDTSFAQAEDTEWYTRARDAGLKMKVIDEVLVHKRLHGNSTTYSAVRARQWRLAVLRIAKRVLERQRT
jgi:glycosyltransferase involved in cell wall biosynthesis